MKLMSNKKKKKRGGGCHASHKQESGKVSELVLCTQPWVGYVFLAQSNDAEAEWLGSELA